MRYVCLARLDGGSVVFLWEGGDVDRVVLDGAGSIQTFLDEAAARAGGVSPERTAVFDLDAIEAWCRSADPPLACSALLNAWNLFGDLPRSDLYADADARANAVHRKLFYACNLPAVTPPGEHFVPTWDVAELGALRHVLVLGLAAFRARLPQKPAIVSDMEPTLDDLAAVAAMLPDIERIQAAPSTWGGGEQPDGSMQMPYAILAPEAQRLLMATYDHHLILYDFDWMRWTEAERFFDAARLATASLLDLRRLFTYHVRQDRFVEGHFASVIANGQIAAMLRRLAQLAAAR